MTNLPPHDWHAPIITSVINAYGRSRKPVYIEIGIDRGHTCMYVFKNSSAQIHGVDITMENLVFSTNHPDFTTYEMSSDDFFSNVHSMAIRAPDVIFIDGDHSAKQVYEDFLHALEIIEDSGTIILHDTLPLRQEWVESHCSDAYKTVERLTGIFKISDALHISSGIQVWTLPLFPGLTFVSKQYRPLLDR